MRPRAAGWMLSAFVLAGTGTPGVAENRPGADFDLAQWVAKYEREIPPRLDRVQPSSQAGERDISERQFTAIKSVKGGRDIDLGPIGVHVLMQSQREFGSMQMRQAWPLELQYDDGLAVNCLEVTKIYERSPSLGRLDVGDLIYEMDGKRLRDGRHFFLDRRDKIGFTSIRLLKINAGLALDAAEERGHMDLSVFRFPKDEPVAIATRKVGLIDYTSRIRKVSIPTRGASSIRLHFPLSSIEGGRKRGVPVAAMVHVIAARLTGRAGELSLTKVSPLEMSAADNKRKSMIRDGRQGGWRAEKGSLVGADGKPLTDFYVTQVGASFVYSIPEGYDHFECGLLIARSAKVVARTHREYRDRREFVDPCFTLYSGRHPVRLQGTSTWKPLHRAVGDGPFSVSLSGYDRFRISLEPRPAPAARTERGRRQPPKHRPLELTDVRLVDRSGVSLGAEDWNVAWTEVDGEPGALRNNGLSRDGGLYLRDAAVSMIVDLPQGEWRLEGEVAVDNSVARTFVIEGAEPWTPPAQWKPYIKKVRVPVDRTGSFGREFDPDGLKVRNYSAMLALGLLQQQKEDGRWSPRTGAYSGPTLCTSMCGLGLMATGDPGYDDAIRKAAYFVAEHGGRTTWTYIDSFEVVFLAEYYLRTRDPVIFGRLELLALNLTKYLQPDYLAGHKSGPGYSGYGWIGPSGVLAAAWALCSHTPIGENDELMYNLDRLLERASEIGPAGKLPYGRGDGFYRNNPGDALTSHGQAGALGNAPCFIACRLRGGTEPFRSAAQRIYTTPPYGNCDQAHGGGELSMTWATAAAANVNREHYIDSMTAIQWLLSYKRPFHGYLGVNTGDASMALGGLPLGQPFFGLGNSIFMLNAGKRNLAITGKAEYQTESARPFQFVHRSSRRLHRTYHRSWIILDAFLGQQSPTVLKEGLRALEALPVSPRKYGERAAEIARDYGPRIDAALKRVRGLSALETATCRHLAFGYNVEILNTAKPAPDGSLMINTMLACNRRLNHLRGAFNERTDEFLPRVTGTVTIEDHSRRMLREPITVDLADREGRQGPRYPFDRSLDPDLVLKCDYRIGETAFKYEVPIVMNMSTRREQIHEKHYTGGLTLRLKGHFVRPYGRYSTCFMLRNGYVLDLNGGGMKRVLDGEPREDYAVLPPGLQAEIEIGGQSFWEQRLLRTYLTRQNLDATVVTPSLMSKNGEKGTEADVDSLSDFDFETGPAFSATNGSSTAVYEFEVPLASDWIYINAARTGGVVPGYRIEAWRNGGWELVASGYVGLSRQEGTLQRLPEPIGARKVRVTCSGATLRELRFHRPFQVGRRRGGADHGSI